MNPAKKDQKQKASPPGQKVGGIVEVLASLFAHGLSGEQKARAQQEAAKKANLEVMLAKRIQEQKAKEEQQRQQAELAKKAVEKKSVECNSLLQSLNKFLEELSKSQKEMNKLAGKVEAFDGARQSYAKLSVDSGKRYSKKSKFDQSLVRVDKKIESDEGLAALELSNADKKIKTFEDTLKEIENKFLGLGFDIGSVKNDELTQQSRQKGRDMAVPCVAAGVAMPDETGFVDLTTVPPIFNSAKQEEANYKAIYIEQLKAKIAQMNCCAVAMKNALNAELIKLEPELKAHNDDGAQKSSKYAPECKPDDEKDRRCSNP